jgi:hypothetical protein
MRKLKYLSLSLPALLSAGLLMAQNNTDEKNTKKEIVEKEINQEMSVDKNSDILIEAESRTIEIKTWDQPKVKLSTKISFSGTSEMKDEEWFDRLNVSLKTLGSSVRILAKPGYNFSSYSYSGGSVKNVRIVNEDGVPLGKGRSAVTVYVPRDAKLEIDNKYGNIKVDGNLGMLKLISTNGNVEAGNIEKFSLRSKYGNVLAGDIKNADVEIMNGHFTAKNIDRLDIDSKYASVEAVKIQDATVRSTNDDYDVDEAGSVQGRKAYGSFRINTLKKAIDMEGGNADIKIRNIASTTETVKINNKYADLRLPVRDLKAYQVDMQGRYNTVYASFEKKPVKDKDENTAGEADGATAATPATGAESQAASGNGPATTINRQRQLTRVFTSTGNDDTPAHFTARVGEGKGTVFTIVCNSCTVDFK